MSVIKCPADCDCPWTFLHSIIKNGAREFIVCQECHEWTGKPPNACSVGCRCHEEVRELLQEAASTG